MNNITFLSPLYLVGLASAFIPLLIHLSRSRRTRKIRFSTTRFFTDQFLRSYRMSRLKELLLLLCRMALFALLAMALARPFVLPRGAGAAGTFGGGPRTVVLVLDDSASMGYQEEGTTLFRRAQDAARSILVGLSPGDTASIVLAGRRANGPEVLFVEPTSDLEEVKAALERAQVRALATDLSGAIARAEEIAVSSRVAGRAITIHVLSDLQESGWDLPPRQTFRADVTDVSFVFVDLSPRTPPSNRAVTAIRHAATRPQSGVPFAIRPLLALSRGGAESSVRLHLDGARLGEQKVEPLPGGKWAAPRFYHTFPAEGWHAGSVELEPDNLPVDDRRYFALEVPARTTVPILAVNGAPSSVPHQDELFFLRFALSAVPEGVKPPFDLRAIAPTELASADLKDIPLVVLANVERLSEPAVEKLEAYVEMGGKVLVFLGDRVDRAFYNHSLAGANRRHGGLLPGTIQEAKPQGAGHISAIQYDHRALAAFQEPKLGELLGPGLTFQVMPLEVPPSRVLMRSSGGLPLLSEKAFGKGTVMLFASTCDRDWSDFPIRPAFLLWSRFLADHLTQTPLNAQPGHRTGDIVRLELPPREQGPLWVRTPEGKKSPVPRSSDGSNAFDFADTLTPGIYTVLGSNQENRLGLFAVNLDAPESDLSYLPEGLDAEGILRELKSRLGQPPLISHVTDPATLATPGTGSGQGLALWDLFLFVVLLVGLFEPFLANQISSRLYARQTAAPSVAGPRAGRGLETPRQQEVAR